jgi:exonuclease VII small subunit
LTDQQLESLVTELEGWRDRIRDSAREFEMGHVLTAACYIPAGEVQRMIKHINQEIEARQIAAVAAKERHHDSHRLRKH